MFDMVSMHALGRVAERLEPEERALVTARLDQACREHPRGSVAARVLRLRRARNTAWADESNGDTVWAIVRDGEVRTVMLRRSTQPANRAAFGVESVDVLDVE